MKKSLPLFGHKRGSKSDPSGSTYVRLIQSTCLKTIGSPYDIRSQYQETDGGKIFELSYADDVYFTSTNVSDSPFLTYARTQLGMQYSPENTLKYYPCPQIGIDMGAVVAVESIAAFAVSHPDIAPIQRASLLAATRFRNTQRAHT